MRIPATLLAQFHILKTYRRRSVDWHANFAATDLPGSNGRLVKAQMPQVVAPLYRTHFDDSQRAADTLATGELLCASQSIQKT